MRLDGNQYMYYLLLFFISLSFNLNVIIIEQNAFLWGGSNFF